MAIQSLLKPQGASGTAILKSGSTIGTSGSTVYMKVMSSRFALGVGVLDTTGDGDAFAQVDHNNEWRGQITFNGFMLAGNHLGIQTLQDATSVVGQSSVNPVTVKFGLGYEKTYEFKMMIQNVVIDWNRQAPVVGVSIVGMLTGASPDVTTEAFNEA